MVEANPSSNKTCVVKHFALDEEHSYAQISLTVEEEEYNRLIDANSAEAVPKPGQNKVLIQCLDISGSMGGSPIEALKIGAKIIGEKYFDAEERPFEEFHTYCYNNECEAHNELSKETYE